MFILMPWYSLSNQIFYWLKVPHQTDLHNRRLTDKFVYVWKQKRASYYDIYMSKKKKFDQDFKNGN